MKCRRRERCMADRAGEQTGADKPRPDGQVVTNGRAGADVQAIKMATGSANWFHRLELGLGLLMSLVVVGIHLEYQRHAGGLWRDEAQTANLATLPSLGDVFAKFDKDSFPGTYATIQHIWMTACRDDSDTTLRRL